VEARRKAKGVMGRSAKESVKRLNPVDIGKRGAKTVVDAVVTGAKAVAGELSKGYTVVGGGDKKKR